MSVFENMLQRGHEQVSFFTDPHSGLKGIVAIHNTTLGPSLGGCRMWMYDSEDEALIDVLRLAKGMTYKAAIAGLNLGGGKAVIIGNSKTDKSKHCSDHSEDLLKGLVVDTSQQKMSVPRLRIWNLSVWRPIMLQAFPELLVVVVIHLLSPLMAYMLA